MSLLAVGASRAAAVRPLRASAASGEAAAPAAGDQTAERRPVKIILPKKKPEKWSTGMEPGSYGGGPTTVKPRKYWMGKEDRDPVGNKDDFIWNKNFMPHMERVIANGGTDTPATIARVKQPEEGFLSFNRAMSLDSVDVDLSKELLAPTKSILKTQVNAARRGLSTGPVPEVVNRSTYVRWKLAPTRREQEQWDRATRATTGGIDVILRESQQKVQQKVDPKVSSAEAREQYLKLKENLQLLTLGIGGVGLVSAYVSYTPEIAASFGVGLIGSVVYLRMLGTSVDSLAGGTKAAAKGAAAQPRLLIPMVLVMMYNRWNAILVPDYGFMHLELIPMLVGFFTYKIAMFTQAIQESIPDVGNREV
ncbi:protein CONSERVED ONLY IN THE GREEN LINEAGE 160, chloroplastic isoform X1 [Lolium rigidum]|uniref:protein CONSERVED ONLY IN THE GREEN LINEAGE 160, chloroplastic isoform X1 n=1 Tax=Lolium rigidum TaxID=89674 RepID=UPI001F5CE8A0|nr:protein CONSERVED ONLY IN THE GREEN LINEAGE 160, chloroplastic isoform X1 [Lolium rigidum]